MERSLSATDNTNNIEQVYTPAAIVHLFNNAINVSQAKKLVTMRGIYIPKATTSYSGMFYDVLKEEASDYSLTAIVPALIRNELVANKVILVQGFITKKVTTTGRIDIQFNITDLVEQTQNKYSEEDLKAIALLQRKAANGYKDVHSWMKERIVNEIPFKIGVIIGRTGIIDNDIKHQLRESISYYNLKFHRVSLTSETEIIAAMTFLENQDTDIIVLSRGGGENLDIFNKPAIAEKAIGLNALFVSAIGHKDDVTLLQKVADKAFITPSEFGQFLNDTYNHTLEEAANSKARLVEAITAQLKANYQKQIDNLSQQLKAVEELKIKSTTDIQKISDEKILLLNKQLETAERNYRTQQQEAQKITNERVALLTQQIQAVQNDSKEKDRQINHYRSQVNKLESKTSFSISAVIIGIVIGIILTILLLKR